MRGLLVENGVVTNVAVFNEIPDGWVTAPDDEGVGIGWTDNGDGSFSAPVKEIPVLTDEEKVALYRLEVGAFIDAKARSLGFDSIVTAVTYADEPADPINQSYGVALRAWRSKCWAKCREGLATWQESGNEPTVEELIESLPEFQVEE